MMYKGYEIDNTTFLDLITVCYEGDEIIFDSIEDARAFIDSLSDTLNKYESTRLKFRNLPG